MVPIRPPGAEGGTPLGAEPARPGSTLEVLLAFLRLGLTSFGGPIAHLGYYREEYVVRRGWLTESAYADLVALCQFLPGPASTQVHSAIGILRAGLPGGLAAWAAFTQPSALALTAFALGLRAAGVVDSGWLHGLKVVAVLATTPPLQKDAFRADIAVKPDVFGQAAQVGEWGKQVGEIDNIVPHAQVRAELRPRQSPPLVIGI